MGDLTVAVQYLPTAVMLANRRLLPGFQIEYPDKRIVQADVAGVMRRAVTNHQGTVVVTHQVRAGRDRHQLAIFQRLRVGAVEITVRAVLLVRHVVKRGADARSERCCRLH